MILTTFPRGGKTEETEEMQQKDIWKCKHWVPYIVLENLKIRIGKAPTIRLKGPYGVLESK